MSNNSGYDDRGQDSQIRSIIKQLNEERPSKEKSREVVVRADGSKVVRVVKKRKIMISGEEKAKKARRRFITLLLTLFVLGGLMAAFFAVRMSIMSGDSYVQERQEQLREAWGAKSVRCIGAQVSGFQFTAEALIVEFDESSMIERVEMHNLSAELASASFFSGVIQGVELQIGSAEMRLRGDVDKLVLPKPSGKELWKFTRISCPKFSLTVGEESSSPLSIKNSSAYLYSSQGGGSGLVVLFDGGDLLLSGMEPATITSGKVLLSPAAVESFSFTCTIPDPTAESEEMLPKFAVSGKVENGGSLAGPHRFLSNNVRLDALTGRCFARFFSARTNDKINSESSTSSYVKLPFNGTPLAFHGKMSIKDVSLYGMPALDVLNKHLRTSHSVTYSPSQIKYGSIELLQGEGTMGLQLIEVIDAERLCVKGTVTVDSEEKLSGSLEYGVPVLLARAEYTDDFADRVFNDDNRFAWLVTTVSGTARNPGDNARELDAEAEPTREGRKRSVDLDSFVDSYVSSGSSSSKNIPVTPATPSTPSVDTPAAPAAPSTPAAPSAPTAPAAPTDTTVTPTPTAPSEPATPATPATPTPGSEEPSIQIPGLQLPSDDIFGTGASK